MGEVLFANQEKEENGYVSKFAFIHNDIFGRTMSLEEIKKAFQCDKDFYKVKNLIVLSTDKRGDVNLFVVEIFHKSEIEDFDELDGYADVEFDVMYYEIIPIDFNKYSEGDL